VLPPPGIDYSHLDQGSFLHFATIGTNNGHDGLLDPNPFLLPDRIESVTDFSYRSVHVAVGIGKQIASSYYGVAPHRSYYNGCSAGGREGISVASRYPEDFDGIAVGAPALDWSHFLGAYGILAPYIAANTSREIPMSLWQNTITPAILSQCDGLDGKMDGIISDPSLCQWNPETVLCRPGGNGTSCLTRDQVDGLRKFYQPVRGANGTIIFPTFERGAEADLTFVSPMNGNINPLAAVRQSLLGEF